MQAIERVIRERSRHPSLADLGEGCARAPSPTSMKEAEAHASYQLDLGSSTQSSSESADSIRSTDRDADTRALAI